MEYRLKITKRYLGIPVKASETAEPDLRVLEIFSGSSKIMEFQIPVNSQDEAGSYDYLSFLCVEAYRGRELCLSGSFPSGFFQAVEQREEAGYEEIERPLAHFTAQRGWINDPNGLVWDKGIYHLYFQYNPFDVEWQNMSWGHAVSRDLVHWRQMDTVLLPDEAGTVFSGCGLVNERGCFGLPKDALLFFYTAAGGNNRWSAGRQFTQRMAYSLDGGMTLVKYPGWELAAVEAENRDPKVFWHEESGSYIMALWLVGNEFALFRSGDLERWEMTQRLELEKAWECPDLFCLETEDGEKKWVFWSADGFYYVGTFDGYSFVMEEGRKEAYRTPLPYAAQTYSGVGSRVISTAWLRTRHEGRLYTGAMALPRELSLRKAKDGFRLILSPAKEFFSCLEKRGGWTGSCGSLELKEERPAYVTVDFLEAGKPACLRVFGTEIRVSEDRKRLLVQGRETALEEEIRSLCLLLDRGILEITANDDIMYLTFELSDYRLTGAVDYRGAEAEVTVSAVENFK